ncbi:hypothetical protein BgiBS90_014307, partial [Biomphalaria glabrata]
MSWQHWRGQSLINAWGKLLRKPRLEVLRGTAAIQLGTAEINARVDVANSSSGSERR